MSHPDVSVVAPPNAATPPPQSTVRTWFRRCLRGALWLILTIAAIILLGLIPVNNDFQPTPHGIEIFVMSNPVHAEIVMPIQSDVIDWRDTVAADCFSENTSEATHIAIGWGDRGFFLQTQTWDDLKFSVAANALLLPSTTCLHVTMKRSISPGPNIRSVWISTQQYATLVDHIRVAFDRDHDGHNIQVADAHYSGHDAFFESHGTYHLLNTCNSWVGRALKTTGVRVGWLTPLPKTVFWYLPNGPPSN